ncbi:hypothetical protein CJ030_MR0G013376 [Morella rubra]|uniref:Uncharacterized protein n=1 Tax=Morella rubra TaxID=262757 RepID=A0A6A1UI16_9ROSI|nr:hypothetical protein CJ030_MR0G013376 [Morella rubra]
MTKKSGHIDKNMFCSRETLRNAAKVVIFVFFIYAMTTPDLVGARHLVYTKFTLNNAKNVSFPQERGLQTPPSSNSCTYIPRADHRVPYHN